jgi:hypothetical protein
MTIILTLAGEHLPGAYTYRTDDQRLIGRIFTPRIRADFDTALRQYRRALGYAPIDTDPASTLSASSRRYIARWMPGDGIDNTDHCAT